jgi:alkylation response protein AidB-like acyl-CoA dehydrogenase
VLQATGAARLIVSARAPDGSLGLYLVAPDAPGLSLRPYRTLDGRSVADIRLDSVPGERLGTEDASAALERVLDLAATALCAESMAIIAELNAATLEYARTRRQFGHAIGTFQVIQHRLVDMMTAEQEGWAVTRCAQRALDDGVADAWRIVSVAKARVDHTARFVGEQAIQLHGGLGITDELMIGHQVKRLILNTTLLGDAQWHLDRLGRDL